MLWEDLEAVVPAVMSIPERADSVKELLSQLGKQCHGIVTHIIPQWHNGPNSRDAFESLERGLQSIHKPWILYFEDDAELAPDFGEKALPIIESIDKQCGVISFFSCWNQDVRMHKEGVCLYEPFHEPFTFSQGVAIRLEIAKRWREQMLPWWDNAKMPYHHEAQDQLLGECCYEMGYKILTCLPNLVEHRFTPSAYGHDHNVRSKTFGVVLKEKYQKAPKKILWK